MTSQLINSRLSQNFSERKSKCVNSNLARQASFPDVVDVSTSLYVPLPRQLQCFTVQELIDADKYLSAKYDNTVRWYLGSASRKQAETLLLEDERHRTDIDGLFVLRDCSNGRGNMSLTVLSNFKIYHYRLFNFADCYFRLEDGKTFFGLDSIVKYCQSYKQLVCKLSRSPSGKCIPIPMSTRSTGISTVLHRACSYGNANVVERILEINASADEIGRRDSSGSTALHIAASFGHYDIVELLLLKGADVTKNDCDGRTPLLRATAGDHVATCQLLIDKGSDVNAMDKNKNCALHIAAKCNSFACAALLIKNHSPLFPRNRDNLSPVQIAASLKHTEVYDMLKQRIKSAFKISAKELPYLHSHISKDEAKRLMSAYEKVDGSFLVRRSETNKSYVLSLMVDCKLLNYEIQTNETGLFHISDGPMFFSIDQLIDHYSRFTDRLKTKLTKPITITARAASSPFNDLKGTEGLTKSKEKMGKVSFIEKLAVASSQESASRVAKAAVQNVQTNVAAKPTVQNDQDTDVATPPPPPAQKESRKSKLWSIINSFDERSGDNRLNNRRISSLSTFYVHPPVKPIGFDPSRRVSGAILAHAGDKAVSRAASFTDLTVDKCDEATSSAHSGSGYEFNANLEVPDEVTVGADDLSPSGRTLHDDNVLDNLPNIDFERIDLIKKVGEGEFGIVYEASYRKDDKGGLLPVAVKRLRASCSGMILDFRREADIMARLRHPCIVKVFGMVENKGVTMMVQEFVHYGSLLAWLRVKKDIITMNHMRKWATQIADALNYMNQKKFVHRDLSARNVLVSSMNQVKVCDFGLSRSTTDDIYLQSGGGKIPIKWYALESIEKGIFSCRSDVWSYGVTLWEIFTFGKEPYERMTGAQVYEHIRNGGKLNKPVLCPTSVYNIICACTDVHENKRPNFEELMHSFSK